MKRFAVVVVVSLTALLLMSILAPPVARAQSQPPPGTGCAFSPGCTISLSTSSGLAGTSVTVTASGYYPNDQYTVYFLDATEDLEVASGLTGTGSFTATFLVPNDPPGPATVYAFDGVEDNASAPFTLTSIPTLALSPAEGVVGSSTTATGTGFAANVGPITFFLAGTFAFVTTPGGCTTFSDGTFSCTVTIPAVPGGAQTMVASDPDSDSGNGMFTVDTNVTLAPESGRAGTVVAVSGTGFASSSPTISFAFDGAAVTSTCAADPTGSFPGTTGTPCVFTVPPSPAGDDGGQNVVATDVVLTSGSATFTVVAPPQLTINPMSGYVGSTTVLLGTGFTAGDGVQAVFAGADEPCNEGAVVVAGDGSFACTLTIPGESHGPYVVAGSTSADGAISASSSFLVLPQMRITGLGTGPPGTSTAVSATGFFSGDTVSMQFGPSSVTCTNGDPQTVAADGTFTCTFVVPPSSAANNPYPVSATTASDGSIDATDQFTVTPQLTITSTPTMGPVGTTVVVTGAGFSTGESIDTVQMGGTVVTCGGGTPTVGGTGAFTCEFSVPTLGVGVYSVVAHDASDGTIPSTNQFTVTARPAITAPFPAEGPIGATFSLTGSEFTASAAATVAFGGTDLAPIGGSDCLSSSTTITTDASGGFTCTFAVPYASAGTYAIVGTDTTTAVLSSAQGFTVTTPLINVAPGQGAVGTTVTVSGNGFSLSNTVGLIFDSVIVSGCTVGSLLTGTTQGTFSCAFAVPSGTSGSTVRATDVGGQTATGSFTVTLHPLSLKVSPTSGSYLNKITLTGKGYLPLATVSLSGICAPPQGLACYTTVFTIALTACTDGSLLPANTVETDGSGDFSCTFPAPPVQSDAYVITATDLTNSKTVTFTEIQAVLGLKLSATAGGWGPGISLFLSGKGYLPQALVTLSGVCSPGYCSSNAVFPIILAKCTIGTLQSTNTVETDGAGDFKCSFPLPGVAAGPYTITAADIYNIDTVTFTVTQPLLTLQVSPTTGGFGTKITLTGEGYLPLATVTLSGACSSPCSPYSSALFPITLAACSSGGVLSATTVETDGAGYFRCTFLTPGVTQGLYTISAADAKPTDDLGVTFAVTQPPLILNVSPTTGGFGTKITLKGFGYLPLAIVTLSGACTSPCSPYSSALFPITLAACSIGEILSATTVETDGAGDFSCSFPTPGVSQGPYTISTSDGDPANGLTVTLTVTQSALSLRGSPASGGPGTSITLTGKGYLPFATVTLSGFCGNPASCSFTAFPVSLGSCTDGTLLSANSVETDGSGDFSCTFLAPAIQLGPYTLTAADADAAHVKTVNFRLT